MRLTISLFVTLFFISCSNFQSMDYSQPDSHDLSSSDNLNALNAVFKRYQGSPYKYGGTNQQGFDCSGFIGVAYQEAFNISLPRTTEQLADGGKPIRRDQLKAGDIIIFKTSIKQLHAGIYTDKGLFIHASTSKGVVESSLSNDYWKQRYIKARRYF